MGTDPSDQKTEAALPTRALDVNDASTGNILGPYHLLQLIGEGGMGQVWLAEQKQPVRAAWQSS